MRYARTGQNVIIPAEAVSDTSYLEYTSTVESLTAYGSDDGAESVALTGVTAVWDSGLGMFRITVPANQCPTEGHMFYVMVDWTGIIDVKAEFYMTNAEGNIAAIKAVTDDIGTGGITTEQVLVSTDHTFDAGAKTITLLGDYATIELPQILRIINITKGLMVIYDCNDPNTAISYTAPVISYTPDFAYKGTAFANGDKLQITVNKK